MEHVLIFEIRGNYGCFKKFFTTSSILTFDYPPKTSLVGLLGAILGYERGSDELIELSKIRIGIQLLTPVKKIHQGINWLNTKVKGQIENESILQYFKPLANFAPKNLYGFLGVNEHKPSNLQFLKDPHFRIFISNEGISEIYKRLKDSIKSQCYVYSPYLGQTEFLCGVNYLGELETQVIKHTNESKMIPIHSIIPQNFIIREDDKYLIKIEEDSALIVEQMPEFYDNGVTNFNKYVHDRNGRSIHAVVKEYYEINSKNTLPEKLNIVLF
ncbi:MAG: type I-B CRISPR-associated protein Cas5b [Promethearchaeota archaeon]